MAGEGGAGRGTPVQGAAATPNPIDGYEKYLDQLLAKTESAKQDLEKNWMGQITAIGLSLGLIVGLDSVIARYLLADPDSYMILYLVLPAVNTFFFVRFGLIGATFSKARYNAEQMADAIFANRPAPPNVDLSQIYKTNSYFEWVHEKYNPLTFLFLLTIPIIFSLNHALTVYLLYKYMGATWYLYAIVAAYAAICITCYWGYYLGNKKNTPIFEGKENYFIIGTVLLALVAAVVIVIGLGRFDPHPGKLVPKPRPSPAPATSA